MAHADQVRLVRDKAVGVEAIHACFTGHAYDLHRHDDWLVGITEFGVQDFFCRGTRRRSTPGRVILIEPQEIHDGQSGDTGGFGYRMLYLPQVWLRLGLACQHDAQLGFRTTLTDDARLAMTIRNACIALEIPGEPLMRDAALDAVLQALRPHLTGTPPPPAPAAEPRIARRARDWLHDRLADSIGADELARIAGAADRFHLTRCFRAAYGTSPHAYLVQQRLLHARRRLARGEAPADVAAACGFADQSHFGRWFRRAYGMTPAAYRTCCTDVPDLRHRVC